MGSYSTKSFFAWGVESLVSVESQAKWARICKQHNRDHEVMVVKKDQTASGLLLDDSNDYDLIFVDGRPREERPRCVKAAFGRTRFIVEHDSEGWPQGRVKNRKLPWTYMEGREDVTGTYKCIEFQIYDPHTVIWTNDEEAYQQLLEYKRVLEAAPPTPEEVKGAEEASKEAIKKKARRRVGVTRHNHVVEQPDNQHRPAPKPRNKNFPRMR